jgi:citrate lyase subunit beta/citryl-CoA lyase
MAPNPRPRRSLLFVPGDDTHKLDRAACAGADTLILDLEDAVPPDRKDLARGEVSARIRDPAFAGSEVAVRINPAGSAHFQADLASVVPAGARLLMVPKIESALGIAAVAEAVARHEGPDASASVRLLALVETARGIALVSSIGSGTPRLEAMCFGNADFSLDMGIAGSDSSSGVVYQARCSLAIAAVAARVSPIDGVCLAVRDEIAFRREACEATRLGFQGKLCIHPSQVPWANEVFSPSDEEIETARRIIGAWDAASARGQGVFSFDGMMIDEPIVAIHRCILARARRVRASSES